MPNIPKVIKITVTSGVKGQPVTIINRTTGDVMSEVLSATAKLVVDLQNFTNGYTSGDIIDIKVSGGQIGAGSVTTSGDGPQTVSFTTATILAGSTRGVR